MKDVFERYPLPWVHATEVGQIGDVRSSAETKDTVLQVQQVGKNGTAANAARDALAAEIVHRVNTYSDLYEALKGLCGLLDRCYLIGEDVEDQPPTATELTPLMIAGLAALKKAEERL